MSNIDGKPGGTDCFDVNHSTIRPLRLGYMVPAGLVKQLDTRPFLNDNTACLI